MGLRERGRWDSLARGERLAEPAAALAHQPARAPEAHERAGELQAELDLAGRDRPRQRGTDVVVLLVEAHEPERLVRAGELRLGGQHELEVALGVPPAQLLELALGLETFERILTDRLEQTEARLAVGAVRLADEALVDERGETLEHLPEVHLVAADGVGDLQRATAREDTEPRQQGLLGRLEQVVAPVDRVAERALPCRQVVRAAGEEVEPLLEPPQDRLRREQLHPSCRELDRERKTVEAPADPRHCGRVLVRELEARLDRAGAVEEELDGGRACERASALTVRLGQGERRHRELPLLAQAQRGLARHERGHSGRRAEQLVDERRRGQHLLEVVEHEQAGIVSQPSRDRLDERHVGGFLDAEHARDRRAHDFGVADRGQVDEERSAELSSELRGRSEGEPRLARAARAGERYEPDAFPAGEVDQCLELLVAADQRGRLRGEVDEDGLCASVDRARPSRGRDRLAAEAGPHCLDHLPAGSRPLLLVLGKRSRDHVVQLRRQLGPELGGRRRRIEQVRVHDRDVRLAVEGLLPGQALEEQAAERVDVGLWPDRLALDLLRRRVVERADEEAGPGQPSFARLLRDPEVGQVDAVGGGIDQHIGGLHVPMDEVVSVSRVERPRHLLEDRDRTLELELPCGDQPLEVAAADVPHGDVDDAVLLAGVVDRDDARVVERRDHLRLLDEALAEVAVAAEVVRERLDRRLAAEDRVLGFVDEAHPTAAEQSGDAVAGDLRADEAFSHAAVARAFPSPSPVLC